MKHGAAYKNVLRCTNKADIRTKLHISSVIIWRK